MQETVDRFCSDADGENKEYFVSLVEPTSGPMLDVGCNEGAFTLKIAQKAKASTIHGIEIDPESVKKAKAKGIKVKAHDLNQPLPYKDRFFSLVTANQVIEHLYFTDDFITEIKRVLKPGGQLVISTTNLAAWHYRIQLLFGQQPICLHPSQHQFGNLLRGHTNPRYGHKSVFTHRAFKQFLVFHGFEIIEDKTVRMYPLKKEWSQKLLKWMPEFGTFSTVSVRKTS